MLYITWCLLFYLRSWFIWARERERETSWLLYFVKTNFWKTIFTLSRKCNVKTIAPNEWAYSSVAWTCDLDLVLISVHYRLENEKLIVWSAFLRLELVYGSEDTLDNVKRRALQQMNELKVYQELVKVYISNDNAQVMEKG